MLSHKPLPLKRRGFQRAYYSHEMVLEMTTPMNEHDFACLSPATVQVFIDELDLVGRTVLIVGKAT